MKITSCIQDVAIINRSIQRKSMEERKEMLSDVLLFKNQAEYSDKSRFEELCRMRFPKATYHLMDLSGIPENVWERTDFPVEKLFAENIDENVKEWNGDRCCYYKQTEKQNAYPCMDKRRKCFAQRLHCAIRADQDT